MDFTLPEHLPGLLAEMDAFIEAEIKPLERENMQYFDQRRENARTDWDNGGIPRREWEDLLGEMRKRADKAGWLRYGLPSQFGGRDGTNIDMAVIREHLAHMGLGLHNDLQDESSIVGNFPQVIMMDRFGTDAQKKEWTEALITGERSMAFGLTEPNHGSDATWLETRAVADGDELDPEHIAAAIALLFENFTTVFVGTSGLGLEISDEDAIATLSRIWKKTLYGF